MREIIQQRFDESLAVVAATRDALAGPLAEAVTMIVEAVRGGRGVLIFGNGGSAADAQHIAGELVGRYLSERRGLKAVALTTDTSTLTAVANDYGFERVFARQVEALGAAGDVAVAISTSGNSPNVVAALEEARRIGMKTIALTGPDGGRCGELSDVLLAVPAGDQPTPRIQEAHMVLYHTLCELVEAAVVADG
jgi:D-sedoheptulose 7-phosphate isomerase